MKIFYGLLIFGFCTLKAQVGINTDLPQVTFDITKNSLSTVPDGILIPRLDIEELEKNINLYTDPQNATLLFITSKYPGSIPATKNISEPGYYYFSKVNSNSEGIWMPIGGYSGTDPIAIWVRDETEKIISLGVLSNNEKRPSGSELNISDEGDLAIGIVKAEPNTILDIFSHNKGVLLPRLSKSQRDNISGKIEDGLLIFNTDENCLNYYDNNWESWRSICGTVPTSKMDLISCTQPEPKLILKQGKALTDQDNYILKLNVLEAGTFTATVKSTNGYSFSKWGTFNQVGTFDVYLDGQGVPANDATADPLAIIFNGIKVDNTSCSIKVEKSSTTFTFDCSKNEMHGTFKKGVAVNNSNYEVV